MFKELMSSYIIKNSLFREFFLPPVLENIFKKYKNFKYIKISLKTCP